MPTPLALSAKPIPILLMMTKTERGLVALLNFMAQHNAELLRERDDLPGLYESGVVYEREKTELWCDYLALLERGAEDCDGLAAARAGELIARGWSTLTPIDGGYEDAQRLRPSSIPAWVVLRTRGQHGQANLYHCITVYSVGGKLYRDDPSARLGMLSERRHPWPNPNFRDV